VPTGRHTAHPDAIDSGTRATATSAFLTGWSADYAWTMTPQAQDPYSVLGLDRSCSSAQVRDAYRILAKQCHPDLNPNDPAALARIQTLNAAYELLIDPERRSALDDDRTRPSSARTIRRPGASLNNISQDAHLSVPELIHGTTLTVRVSDPGKAGAAEEYELVVPPATPPGCRLKVCRVGGGVVTVRLKALARPPFKVRGSNLCCDLPISCQRAAQGGQTFITGADGSRLSIHIPVGIARGGIIRVPGQGLPKMGGGRGDLMVRVRYNPTVTIRRRNG
jgi:hypothetical protein